MPTPARSATADIGATGSARNTSRAACKISASLCAAWAWRPLGRAGFRLDHDVRPTGNIRVVQMTPPGSACSVVIGEGLPLGEPGSVKGVQLVVEDLDAVRAGLAGRGVGISGVQQMGPEGTPGSRYCFFDDPDGNTWAIQEYKRT